MFSEQDTSRCHIPQILMSHTQGSDSLEKLKGSLAKHICNLVNDFVQIAESELSF